MRPLDPHRVEAELVVECDGLPDFRSQGLVTPVVVEPTREAKVADELLRRNVQLPGGDHPQGSLSELVLGEHAHA
jgi:hypothetical protein